MAPGKGLPGFLRLNLWLQGDQGGGLPGHQDRKAGQERHPRLVRGGLGWLSLGTGRESVSTGLSHPGRIWAVIRHEEEGRAGMDIY